MNALLWLVPALPFAGFLAIVLGGRGLARNAAATIGCATVGISALVTVFLGVDLLRSPPPEGAIRTTIGTWMSVGDFEAGFSLLLDPLALLMTFVVTFVGFLIHVYSTGYMRDDAGFNRFFAYLNLFVGSMLVLVLADNLLLLLLGWEGVGACSYLLIGFWYEDPANGRAARKAFVVTRIGDTSMLLGLFLLFHAFGTLDMRVILQLAPERWATGSSEAVLAAALLLGGAVGKSAQLPLQVWLPDAMAGPTPVSALIHAATMVTAGVYLIARMHGIFLLAPPVMAAVAVIGACTLLLAAGSALCQRDIKRVLAYSTISQIGYMFLALGVGAWSAAMFHFLTHAFFKALLFLGAGAVILAQHHKQDMFEMGGLRRKLPLVFWTFVVGSASLAAVPLVTSGFFSKEAILLAAWTGHAGHPLLWLAGAAGAGLTALYTTRMVALTFFGESKTAVGVTPGRSITAVLVVLAIFSTCAGWIELPHSFGEVALLSGMLHGSLGDSHVEVPIGLEVTLQLAATAIVLAGVVAGWWIHRPGSRVAERVVAARGAQPLRTLAASGWGFDALYRSIVTAPFGWFARINRGDFVDAVYAGVALAAQSLNAALSRTQTGLLRWYAVVLASGVLALLALALSS